MRKILILGNNYHVDALIREAKKRGLYTIVSDYNSVSESPYKALADEAWDIDINDLDALEKKAREAEICAVVCGASKLCMDCVRRLCKRLSLPFYVSDEAYSITNDKSKFKKLCEESGLLVPKEYRLSEKFKACDLEKIVYPVVVKPADGYSSIGMHRCDNEAELISGYRDAMDKSAVKKVVAEEYLEGEEVDLLFVFRKGESILVETSSVFGCKEDGVPFLFGGTPMMNYEKAKAVLMPGLNTLFEKLGCRDGVGSVQMIRCGSKYRVMEMNYRLPGGQVSSQNYLVNVILDCALSENVSAKMEPPVMRKIAAAMIWLKPGRISEIRGIDFIREKLPLQNFNPMKKEGDLIEENTGMRQCYAIFAMDSGNLDVARAFNLIYDELCILDENGNDMIRRYSYEDFCGVMEK